MGVLGIILIVLFGVVALLLSFFVLIQDDQGEGLGGLFGGGGSSTPFGAASNSVLSKVTAFLGILFVIFSLLVAYILRTPDEDKVEAEARRLEAQSQEGEWFEFDEETLGLDTAAGELLVFPEE